MSVTVINNFKFSGGSIFELKFNDLPSGANKAARFQWYLCLYDQRYDLKFIEMTATLRHFTYNNTYVTLDITEKLLKTNTYGVCTKYKLI